MSIFIDDCAIFLNLCSELVFLCELAFYALLESVVACVHFTWLELLTETLVALAGNTVSVALVFVLELANIRASL